MNPADFHAPQAGRIVRTAAGNAAFVPAPLPPHLEFDLGLVRALSRADAALSELSGLGVLLPNPHLLIAPYESVSQARDSLRKYIDIYNVKRPHSSLARRTPDEGRGAVSALR